MTAHSLRARFKETVSGAILDAAEELAAESGPAGASLQAIAKRAGIAVGTIYNHFADRNELFLGLFERRRAELLADLDAAAKKVAGAPFDKQLLAYVRTVFTFFDTRRAFLRVALEWHAPKTKNPRESNSLEQLKIRAERIVKIGVKEKRLKTEGADLFALFLVAAVRALLISRADSPKPLADETESVIALFMQGAER